jgi:hypothetical protein
MAGMNRRSSASVALVLILSACAPSHTEVPAAPGRALDCPVETIETTLFGTHPEAPGSSTPSGALVILSWDFGMPQPESETDNEVVFVYRDSDGDRVASATVARSGAAWFIQQIDQCS